MSQRKTVLSVIVILGMTCTPIACWLVFSKGVPMDDFVKEITKVGGTVLFEHDDPDRPIIGVILRGSKIDGADLMCLVKMPKLRILYLQGIKNPSVGTRYLQQLANLEELYFGLTSLSDADLDSVANLPALRVLELAGTKISDTGLKKVTGLEKLEDLNLSGTQITDTGVLSLKKMTNLRTLRLDGTKVTKRAIEALQRDIPGLTVLE
jgi:Leucine-rich repeat (LRR) protein